MKSNSVHNLEECSIQDLLVTEPKSEALPTMDSFDIEQTKDPKLAQVIAFLQNGDLPQDEKQARKVAAQAPLFVLVDIILFYLDSSCGNRKCVAVPSHLRLGILEEYHSGPLAGHFSGA